MELVAHLHQQLLRLHPFLPVYHRHNYTTHQPAALHSLDSVVGCEALQSGVLNSLIDIIAEGDWEGSQSHQRTVPIIESIALFSVGLLLLQEFVHRNRNVASQANGPRPTPVVESQVQPQGEEVSNVLRVELISINEDAVGKAEPHRGIVSPYSNLAVPRLDNSVFDGIKDIFKAVLDDSEPLLAKGKKLGGGPESISNRHA